MNPRQRSHLDRVCADSAAMNLASARSCEDTADHIASSRKLIARSLELLRLTKHRA